jgi:hypothetical protein
MDGQTVPKGNQHQPIVMGVASIDPGVAALFVDGTPYDFCSAVIEDRIINGLLDETNVSATQKLLHGSDITPYFRLLLWQPSTKEQMKKFVGLLHGWAWCSSLLLQITRAKASCIQMSGFKCCEYELVLTFVMNFTSNEECPPNNRLHKIQSLFRMCIYKFQGMVSSGKTAYIDKTIVPFSR